MEIGALDKELEKSLNEVFRYANELRHEFLTVEHMLLMLTNNNAATDVLHACGLDIEVLKKELEKYIKETTPLLLDEEDKDSQPTLGFQRVLQRALFHVQSSGQGSVSGANVLVAIFSEQDSHSVYLLNKHNIERLDVTSYITSETEISADGDALEADFLEQEYDENFDYKTLLRQKDEEIEKQKIINVELKKKIQISEKAIQDLEQQIESQIQEETVSIIRSIEFKPEHRQAGLSILSYFSEIVLQKYPNKKISVSIEQHDDTIRLCVQTADGDREIIEKTLEKYGMVVTGKLPPQKLLTNPIHVAQLEHKIDLANTEIRSTQRLLDLKDETINDLKESMRALIDANRRSQESLQQALKKVGSTKEIDAVVKLIKTLETKKQLDKKDISKIEESIVLLNEQNPSAIDEIQSYFMNVSSSMVGSIVLNTIKNFGM